MKKFDCFITLVGLVLGLSFTSCDTFISTSISDDEALDGPIATLSGAETGRHIIGDEEFSKVYSISDGLGPIFNAASCEACHIADGRGHAFTTFTRFGRVENGVFDALQDFGGPQLQDKSLPGFSAEFLPALANVHSGFMAPAVTGLGYVEALDDSTLMRLADPEDANKDGISGRLNYVIPPEFFKPGSKHVPVNGKYIARFGRKAMAIDLVHQSVNAFFNDMGISSEYHPQDIRNVQSSDVTDNANDPEISAKVVEDVAFYLRTLKVPPRRNSNDADVIEGEKAFLQVGCGNCHVQTLKTGMSAIGSLHKVEFHPYSDFLLHDMGSELNDGYTEGDALPSEWRTTPLWGIGLAHVSNGGAIAFLHDGRAKTIRQAIDYHGGEAADSRSKFKALNAILQDKILKFLQSL